MRFKKLVSGLLACALVATSVFTGNVTTAKAETTAQPTERIVSEDPVPVSTYDFNPTVSSSDGTLGEGVVLKQSANNSGDNDLNDYTNPAKFVTGRSGEAGDSAVDTEGKHGIVLPDNQLGDNYTVSFWVKPTDLSKDKWATSMLFVGRAKPTPKWVSICTNANGNGGMTCWSDGMDNVYGAKNIIVKQDEWQMITLVQTGADAKFYVNGELKFQRQGYDKAMEDSDQFIALGTNHWDGNYYGVYDDVNVYNQNLTDAQVYRLYSGKTVEECYQEGNITVSDTFKLKIGRDRTISVELPKGIDKSEVDISFAATAGAASVEVDAAIGKVTGKAAGTATITATVQLKNSSIAPKTATVNVEVEADNWKALAVDYDFANSTGKTLTDISGNGHNATIHGNPEFKDGALTFHGGKSTTTDPDYVDLPLSIMNDLDDPEQFTIEVEFAKTANVLNAWLFCLGSNPKKSGTNYMFLSPNLQFVANKSPYTLRAGITGDKGQAGEKLFDALSIEPEIDKSYTAYMVFDNGNITLYWNGIKIKDNNQKEILESGYSIMDDVITPGCKDNILGYIGKSCWSPDDYYQGTVSKFKIHNKAMTDEEVAASFSGPFEQIFQSHLDKNIKTVLGPNNESKDKVIYNLPLMATYEEAPIAWTSNKPEIITADGTVNNPATATEVELTAKVTSGALTGTAKITLTVLPADKSKLTEAVAKANEAIANPFRGASKDELEKLIAKASVVTSQTDVDKLVSDINKAIAKNDYSPLYMNPFTEIPDDFNPAVSEMITLKPAEKKTVKAKDIPDKVKDAVNVTYESMATDVATVDGNGMVTAQNKVGYAMIVTKVSAKYDDFTLEYYTLVKVDIDLSGVKASAKKTTIDQRATTTINVTGDVNGSTKTYRATGAVSVDKNGKVTAMSAGTGKVYVKVSVGGKSITRTITIKVNAAKITGASTVKVKKSITLKVTGISGTVKWSLDKKGKKLATISKKGKLTAKKAGKVKVTAKVGNVSMTKTITIKKK